MAKQSEYQARKLAAGRCRQCGQPKTKGTRCDACKAKGRRPEKTPRRCGICRELGHYSATCPKAPSQTPVLDAIVQELRDILAKAEQHIGAMASKPSAGDAP